VEPEVSPLEAEMKSLTDKYIVPQVNQAREVADKVVEIQKELLSKMERGTAPTDTAAQDLEAQKADLEANLNGMREDIRKLRMEVRSDLAKPEATSSGFDGRLVKNIVKMREAIRQFGTLDNALQRDAVTTSDISTAGALGPDLEAQFLRFMREQQRTLTRVRLRRMQNSTGRLDELVIGGEKIRASVEATAPSLSGAVSFAKRDLNTKSTILAEDLSLEFLEDNIEQAGAESTIVQDLGVSFGNDHNNLFWRGDEGNSDGFLGINDGIIDIAKADGSVVDFDATSVTTVQAVMAGALRALPAIYAAQPNLTFFLPYKTGLTYADEIADRKTVMGDQALVGGIAQATYFGIPVVPEPHLNVSSADEGVLTFADNLVWAVQRGITFASVWHDRKRAVEITITARTDQNYVKSQAVVLIDGIEAALR
jgi:hypothetical protein